MEILKVNGTNPDFVYLSGELEKFQFSMLPVLKEKDYSLTEDLEYVIGYVLYIDGKPIGSIGLKPISNNACEIVRVFISENYRGNNYAKLLFEKIENLAKEMGFEKAEMVAWAKATSALRLYEKLNYNKGEEKISEWYGGNGYVELYKEL